MSNLPSSYKSSFKGYKDLPFFKQSEIVYDFTVDFCKKYLKTSKMAEHMVLSARNGKQNIAEAYLQKTLEGRIRLLGSARGGLEGLLNDYLDFLRQNELTHWEKDSSQAKEVRSLAYRNYKSYNNYKIYISSPESAANAVICLINQTNSLLDQKLRWTEDQLNKEENFSPTHILKKNFSQAKKGFKK